MEKFILKTKIFMGVNSIDNLKNIDIKKVLIICDPFLEKNNMTQRIKEVLEDKNVEYKIFSDIVPDPTIEVITLGLAMMTSLKPDTIIAFGGGSSIDTAKGVKELYNKIVKENNTQLIAIPTTSGTGSEVTSFAVVSDAATQSKYPLIDDEMIPDIAILDSDFTKSVPKVITADTGMDVLTHAIEAYVAKNANDFTDAFSEKAIKLTWDNLIKCYEEPNNMKARTHMHNAATLAGIAFNQAGLGICHSLAHALGAIFHISHGRANAILLPHIISFNANLDGVGDNVALDRYVEIANMLGISCGTKRATVFKLVRSIKAINNKLNISDNIVDLKVPAEDFKKEIGNMSEKALKDKCTLTNPLEPKKNDIEKIYSNLIRRSY